VGLLRRPPARWLARRPRPSTGFERQFGALRQEPGAWRLHRLVSHAYVRLLAESGLLRDDLDADALAYAVLATLEGFIQAEATASPQQGSGIDDRADLLARTVQRAFEAQRRLSPAAEQAIATQVIELFARLGEADRADLGIEQATAPGSRQVQGTPIATTTRS
jgi:hypothetical protein